VRKEYLAKINNLADHHGTGPPEKRGPMQSHRLHRLKAGPEYNTYTRNQLCWAFSSSTAQ